jgi:hypothetical protein
MNKSRSLISTLGEFVGRDYADDEVESEKRKAKSENWEMEN